MWTYLYIWSNFDLLYMINVGWFLLWFLLLISTINLHLKSELPLGRNIAESKSNQTLSSFPLWSLVCSFVWIHSTTSCLRWPLYHPPTVAGIILLISYKPSVNAKVSVYQWSGLRILNDKSVNKIIKHQLITRNYGIVQ